MGAAPLVLVAIALLIRLPHFGDPAYQIDEQFYLLVGDRLLHGAVPYVDIWDRKPIGLFLIYAAIRLLGGTGIWQYQIVATVFAAATACIIQRIASRRAGMWSGLAAGMLYLVWIETVEGGGGQAPVFYNLFVACAAWCVLEAGEATSRARFRSLGFAAMVMSGIAIQIKYTALFECAFLGLVLAMGAWRWAATRARALFETGAFAGTALAPTFAAMLFYLLIGQFPAFWFANFVSIGLRAGPRPGALQQWLIQDGLHIVLLAGCCGASLWHLRQDASPEARRWCRFMLGWIAAALVGFASVGMFYCHYLLPLYVPLCVGAAPIFRRVPIGPVLAALAFWVPFSNLDWPDFQGTASSRREIAAIQALLPRDVDRHCLQILGGPPILYYLGHACLRTRYVFPEHLLGRIEAHAIGIDPAVELARVLASRPAALVTSAAEDDANPASLRVLRFARSHLYRRAGRVIVKDHPVDVWVIR